MRRTTARSTLAITLLLLSTLLASPASTRSLSDTDGPPSRPGLLRASERPASAASDSAASDLEALLRWNKVRLASSLLDAQFLIEELGADIARLRSEMTFREAYVDSVERDLLFAKRDAEWLQEERGGWLRQTFEALDFTAGAIVATLILLLTGHIFD